MRVFRQMLSRLKDNFIIFEAWTSDKLLGTVPNVPYFYIYSVFGLYYINKFFIHI
jgi:hypothetical protein